MAWQSDLFRTASLFIVDRGPPRRLFLLEVLTAMPLMPAMDNVASLFLRPAVLVGLLVFASASRGRAEEPAAKFLEQLRAQGYVDMALVYLDRIDQYPGVSDEFKQSAALERAETFLQAGQRSRVADQRDAYYASASEALRQFVTEQPSHPRRAEAQLRLGNLQLLRGAQLIELGGPPDEDQRKRAKEAFLSAAETFNAIVADLRSVLEEMQGQKIDASSEPEKLALRDRYRAEYLQALLLGGDATKRAAEAIGEETPERTKLFEDALARFADLRDKYDDTLAGILATLYAGQVEHALGRTDNAISSYMVVLDQTDSDVLRIPKVQATIGLMRLYGSQSPPAWREAIDRGQPLVDSIRPDERRSMEFQELRLALADAYLGLAESASDGGEKRRLTSAAREALLPVSKSPGPHQKAAVERLSHIGVDLEQSEALADTTAMPQTFDEALELVNKILNEEKSLTLTAQLLEQRAAEGGESVIDQQTTTRQSLMDLRERGIEVLRHALRIADHETDTADLTQARASLAFLLYRAERFREAAAVGEFIARHYPSSELALSSGLTALGSWQHALRDAGDEQTDAVMAQLQQVADYLVTQWPTDPQAASARELLVRIAIGRNHFEDARRFLQALPADNPSRTELQRAMGRLMWNRAIALQEEGDTDGAQAMRAEASEMLAAGLDNLQRDQVDGAALEAAMLLTRIRMLSDDAAGALAVLESDVYGPLERMDDVPAPRDGFRGEVYATALQALVSQLTAGGADSEALMQRASAAMTGLQEAYDGQPDGDQKLVATYFRLARDIRDQLASAPPDQQQRLTDAFQMFLGQLAENTDDSKTLHWAAQTLLALGQGQMAPGATRASGRAEPLIRSAIAMLEKIESRAVEEPGWLTGEEMLTQVRLELGTAARLVGEYSTALDALTDVLSQNQMLVDAQIEAALVYEQWAANLSDRFAPISYGRAISGAKPDPQTRRNLIWGWGAIAKKTMGNSSFENVFFDARYHLALCRYLKAKVEKDAETSRSTMAQASEDIRNVYILYPELGGAGTAKKFDTLLREIQKALGKPPVGLAEFKSGNDG